MPKPNLIILDFMTGGKVSVMPRSPWLLWRACYHGSAQ